MNCIIHKKINYSNFKLFVEITPYKTNIYFNATSWNYRKIELIYGIIFLAESNRGVLLHRKSSLALTPEEEPLEINVSRYIHIRICVSFIELSI